MKAVPLFPRSRLGRALAHTPHRSDTRTPHTPRGGRSSGHVGRPGTFPPVPGRPNAVHALLAGGLLALFSLISWQVAVSGPLLAVDVVLRDAAAEWSEPDGSLAFVAQVGSDLGAAPVAGGALLSGAGVLAWRRRSRLVVAVAVVAAVSVPALVLPLKEAFGRLGPDGLPLGDYAGYYPSGHAATAAVAYGTLAVLLLRRAPVAAPLTAVVLSVWTGAGLVLRGYHWLTDVVASWALSGVLLCALVAVVGPAGRRLSPGRRPDASER